MKHSKMRRVYNILVVTVIAGADATAIANRQRNCMKYFSPKGSTQSGEIDFLKMLLANIHTIF